MNENVLKLKEWIDGSDNIVFFGGAGVRNQACQTLEVWTDFITRSGIIHQRLYLATHSL